jgi:hypothetical protein
VTQKDNGHFAQKHASNSEADPTIATELQQNATSGEIPCAVAFKIAKELNVTPAMVGETTDLLELRLCKCQMGLFGYKPQKRIVKPALSVSNELEKAIGQETVGGRLPCKKAWHIAEKLGLRKMAVASACEALGVKINACQLGAFK